MDPVTARAVGEGPARTLGNHFLTAWDRASQSPPTAPPDALLFCENVRIFCPDGSSVWMPGSDAGAILAVVTERAGPFFAVQDMRAAFEWAWLRGTTAAPGSAPDATKPHASFMLGLKTERSAGAAGDHHDGPSAAVSEIMLVISKAESPFEDAGVNRATVGPEGGLVGPCPDLEAFPTLECEAFISDYMDVQFQNYRAKVPIAEAGDFVADPYVRYGWADPHSERPLEEHKKSMAKFLDAKAIGMNHWSIEGNSLVLVFSFSLGMIPGAELDGQAVQWYTLIREDDGGLKIKSAYNLPVAPIEETKGFCSSAFWPCALNSIPAFRGKVGLVNSRAAEAEPEAEVASD